MWTLLTGLGLIMLVVGVAAVIRPLPAFHLPTRRRGQVVGLAGFVLLGIGAANNPEAQRPLVEPRAADSAAQAAVTPAAQQVAPSPRRPATPEDRIRAAIRTHYQKPVDIAVDGNRVIVAFDISDRLTMGTLKQGARIDVQNILEGVDASGFDFSHVQLQGSYPLVDRFGNSHTRLVVNVGYDRATVDRINWPNMSYDNIYAIADSAVVHPEFRGE